jgi:hypothetical protein
MSLQCSNVSTKAHIQNVEYFSKFTPYQSVENLIILQSTRLKVGREVGGEWPAAMVRVPGFRQSGPL